MLKVVLQTCLDFLGCFVFDNSLENIRYNYKKDTFGFENCKVMFFFFLYQHVDESYCSQVMCLKAVIG